MRLNNNVSVFGFTNALKVLKFLASNPEKDFIASEVQNKTKLSRPGVYLALRELAAQGLVHRRSRGRLLICGYNYEDPVAKQFKVLIVTLELRDLINKLKDISRKMGPSFG